ncbi:MAG: DUF5305 family protein [Saccharofermentanales bacterium]
MDKTKKSIRRNVKSYLDIFIAILVFFSILFIILSIITTFQPQTTNKTIIKNEIEEKVSFGYYSIVQPSTLYPAGGKIVPQGIILAKLTNDFVIKIETSIDARNPVTIKYKKNIFYKVKAENLWEKEFPLIKNATYTSKSTTGLVKNDEVHLKLKEIYDFIAKVEDETSIRHNYSLEIKQSISGDIYDADNKKIHTINNEYVIPFEISGQYIKYSGDTEENETITKSLIEETEAMPNAFYFWGLNIPLMSGRVWFGVAGAVAIILLIICIIFKSTRENKEVGEKKIDDLEKKHKSRIIPVTESIDLESVTKISISKLKDLFRIADEKEESIYKYSDDSSSVYYMVTPPAIYFYEDNEK